MGSLGPRWLKIASNHLFEHAKRSRNNFGKKKTTFGHTKNRWKTIPLIIIYHHMCAQKSFEDSIGGEVAGIVLGVPS